MKGHPLHIAGSRDDDAIVLELNDRPTKFCAAYPASDESGSPCTIRVRRGSSLLSRKAFETVGTDPFKKHAGPSIWSRLRPAPFTNASKFESGDGYTGRDFSFFCDERGAANPVI